MCKPYLQFLYGTYVNLNSELFINFLSQPKVSFQFLIFKESFYMVFTSTNHNFFIQSHILRLQMGSTTFNANEGLNFAFSI